MIAIWLAVPVVASELPSGKPNRLITETSPYLRLHAFNPVDWYPWGDEAFELAKREHRPIFLSVGYTTCYWCHVMEREVFSDPGIAALMNKWFVNIKVDREERPDIDEIYMTATQLTTGNGGWPNSVFLTPDLKPFFAGTYFPPYDGEGRTGFSTVLRLLRQAWDERRDEVERRSDLIAKRVRAALAGGSEVGAEVGSEEVEQVLTALTDRFDSEWGGFGTGPKFPTPSNLMLLWQAAREGDQEARSMVVGTLSTMGRGAIFDHLDGGFHRYTLDREWRVPHFEKMLYDNALLGQLLAAVALETGDPFLDRLARRTFDFLLDFMQLPNGAFRAAIDAETDGVEGAFYLWTDDEIEAVLDEAELALIAPIFDLGREPNFDHGRRTLYLTDSLSSRAAQLGLSLDDLEARLHPVLMRLAAKRREREFPIVDDKVLADWNGMAIGALATAGRDLRSTRYLEAATRAAAFVLSMRNDRGVQMHVWSEGRSKIPAFLDDYAFLIRGLLSLHDVTGEEQWLIEAQRLDLQLEERLAAPSGGFFSSGEDPRLLVRPITAFDGAVPSGNGVAVLNLLRLTEITRDFEYWSRARRSVEVFSQDVRRVPAAMPTMALAVMLSSQADRVAREGAAIEKMARDVVTARLVTGQPSDASGWLDARVLVEIRNGWHVNANPASLEYLIPTAVSGSIRELVYPAPEMLEVEFAEIPLAVYSDGVEILGELEPGTRSVKMLYQACDDRRCLPPTEVELTRESSD